MSDNCERCGVTLTIGMWPFCSGDPAAHTPTERFGYDTFESYYDEHIKPGGAYIETRGDRMKIMRERGLEYKRQPKPMGRTLYFT